MCLLYNKTIIPLDLVKSLEIGHNESAISKFSCASFSKQAPVHNLSYENEYAFYSYLHVNEKSFSYERLCIKTRFEKEAQDNSEIAHWDINFQRGMGYSGQGTIGNEEKFTLRNYMQRDHSMDGLARLFL